MTLLVWLCDECEWDDKILKCKFDIDFEDGTMRTCHSAAVNAKAKWQNLFRFYSHQRHRIVESLY
jgi:hypothetical protein